MHAAAARALLKAADTLAQSRTRPTRARSPRQQEIAANLSLASRTWRTLSDSQRHAWTALGQTWSPTPGKAAAKGIVVFQALNAIRLNAGQTNILRDAPAQPDFIASLPAFTLDATHTTTPDDASSPAQPGTGTFALTVTSPAFDGPVQVLATRPLSAGVGQPSPKDFRPIALLDALPGTPISLADA